MPRALVSVSDKRGIVPFVQGLVDLGWEVISTGGTAAALKASGVPVIPVDQVTGFPEMLDGRVKTLHPAIHGGILARRELAEHRAAIARHGIGLIDLVAVNLYPFQDTVARPDVIFEDAIENIDIGGPSMLRSAAKNHAQVIPVVDPVDYPAILAMLRGGGVSEEARRELAAKVFAHLADYDSAIARYLTPAESGLPGRLGIAMERLMPLRYGENPDQRAALYVTEEPRGMRDLAQRHGKELSFNNLLDIDAAMQAVSTWDSRIACCIVKHTTPCGIALGQSAREAFDKARATAGDVAATARAARCLACRGGRTIGCWVGAGTGAEREQQWHAEQQGWRAPCSTESVTQTACRSHLDRGKGPNRPLDLVCIPRAPRVISLIWDFAELDLARAGVWTLAPRSALG